MHICINKSYKIPKSEVADTLQKLLCYKMVKNKDKEDLIASLQVYGDKNIAIVDCIIYVRAKQTNSKIFTFDEKLLKLK